MADDAKRFSVWLSAKTWHHIIRFVRVIAILIPVVATLVDIPVIMQRQWERHPAWGGIIVWQVLAELVCLVYLAFDRFAPRIRQTETAIEVFSLVTLGLSTAFGILFWEISQDISIYALGSVFVACVVCTRRKIRKPAYFVSMAVLVGYFYFRTDSAFAVETVIANPICVAIVCMKLDEFVYSQNEAIFREKIQVEVERERADKVLYNVLPAAIADELKEHQVVKAVKFENLGVLFADIVGFTTFSRSIPPDALVFILNQIFSAFDALVAELRLEKIKTIGDAYMAVSTEKADDLALLAIRMIAAMRAYNQSNGTSFQLRIGLHVGPAVAGVIGVSRFLYDVWGDTVNVASRMESTGEPDRIHVSESVREALGGSFRFEARGNREIKGRGSMETFFLMAPLT
jgi:class 3 adenylate cyclase